MLTINRVKDRLALTNERGVEVASLFDCHNHIIFDTLADSAELFDVAPMIDYADFCEKNGITVQSLRLIDLIPCTR